MKKIKINWKINNDLKFTLVNSLWRIVSGPLLLFCIPFFLTAKEQGYWYIFSSFAALAVFADLGFTAIVLQFVAHEFVYLRFRRNGYLTGDKDHLWKLASFFHFVIRWSGKVISIVFPIIMILGYLFIGTKDDVLSWELAWIVYCFASTGSFFNSVILSFFEGCNSVAIIQNIRFKVAVFQVISTIACLSVGANIYTLGVAQSINVILGVIYILRYFRNTVWQLWRKGINNCYDWWPEFSGLIWRYAISWSSGFFIFYIFSPIAFYFYDAEFSGKVGISFTMWMSGLSVANSWIVAISPKINMLVAKQEWLELDRLFNKNLRRAMLTMIVGGCIYFILDFSFMNDCFFFNRVLEPFEMFMLFMSWTMQLWINAVAVYLRAHKQEPLVKLSFFSAVYIVASTLFLACYMSSQYLFLGFFSSFLFSVPITYMIWKRAKNKHGVKGMKGDYK